MSDRLVRIPSGPGKPTALREVVKQQIDTAFGNSRWDADMLAVAKHGFAVNPNPDLEAVARQRHWTVYFPRREPRAGFPQAIPKTSLKKPTRYFHTR